MGKFSGNTTAATSGDEALNGNGSTPKESSDFYDIIGKIIDIGVKIVGTPIYIVAKVLDSFVRHDGTGIRILGGVLLVGGVVMSADSFFQAFGGKPLFPFLEDTWIGIGWLWVWTKVNFWAAVVISIAVQWIESQAIRGKDPDKAKADYDQIKYHQTPEKNTKAIDLVEVRRLEYKRSGMGERSILGLFILFVFIMDIAATFFVGRNPWGQPPTEFIGILIYNTCTMLAGEVGFALWRKANGKN
jgi:hypothetical protein